MAIPNPRAPSEAFGELVLCYTSGLGNSSQIILSDASFNFDKPDHTCVATLVALSDGWLVDANLLHSRPRGTKCVGVFSKGCHTHTHTHTRIDCALMDPTLAGSLQGSRRSQIMGSLGPMPSAISWIWTSLCSA